MANKAVTSKADPLVPTIIYIPKSQKAYLDSLGGSASAYFRKLLASQMGGHEAEIAKLKEELKEHETQANIIRVQIAELEAEANKQQNAINYRETLLDQQVETLVESLRLNGGFVSKIENAMKNIVVGMNRKLLVNGSGTLQPCSFEELLQAVVERAKAQGVELYE